jgi:hypothetical protein
MWKWQKKIGHSDPREEEEETESGSGQTGMVIKDIGCLRATMKFLLQERERERETVSFRATILIFII